MRGLLGVPRVNGVTEQMSWWRWGRLRQLDPMVWDSLLAATLVVVGVVALATGTLDSLHDRPPDALGYLLVVVGMGCLAWRRRHPIVVLGVAATVTTVFTALRYPSGPLPIACLIALYTVATLASRRRSLETVGFVGVLIVVNVVIDNGSLDPGSLFSNALIFGGAYVVGDNIRVRRAYLRQLELRAADLERTQAEEAERAVAQERLRIARELHDVVAHAMSVVAVQSGVAAHVIDQRPAEARQMLDNISATSRDALDEMRRLLGVLRSDSDDPGARAPAPTLEQLDDLIATIETAGVSVELEVEGERPPVPAGVDLSAYRIVQEGLTNVLKHAGSATAGVRVHYETDAVTVEVVDDGRGSAAPRGGDGGHGLVGMRERVAVYGGTLDAGPQPGGGFRVVARLPMAAAVSPA